MMAEIIFNKDFPELAQPTVKAALDGFAWLFPVWLQRLYVGYHADDGDSTAYIIVEKDYRFANLKICGHWISESPVLQKEQILHELIHLYNAPPKNCALDRIKTLCGDDTRLFDVIKAEIVGKNEQATCDLTYAIMKFNERTKTTNQKAR